jgi:hypothetical protein
MKIKEILPYVLFSASVGAFLFSPSCSNTGTPPSGGPKDTIPPLLVRTIPIYNAVNFSGKRIEIKFNEYIKLNDAATQIYLSPPQAKRPQSEVRGKSVVVTFPTPLDSNTTYALDFGHSIQDNNEGNPFGTYTFSFSTGSVIDSLLFSGYVVDAQTLLPIENASILLHTQDADTTVYKVLPRALAKTDLWGYYVVSNLKEIPYHVFALEDLNRNHKYEDNNERIAFLDSLFFPKTVMGSDSLHRQRVDPKDTLGMLNRPVERTLYLFKEHPKRQLLREKVRVQPRHFYFTFSAPYAQIDSLQIEGVDFSSLICGHTLFKDTIHYWLSGDHVPDTLKGIVRYLKTDSLKMRSPIEEKFALTLPKPKQEVQGGNKIQKTAQKDSVHVDFLNIELISKPESVEQTGFLFSFSAYPVQLDPNKITLTYTTTRNESVPVPFTFKRDSLDGCRYSLMPVKWTPAVSYKMQIPQGIFTDVYGFKNDSLAFQTTLPDAENFGSISFTLKGGNGLYIVELLSKTRDRVLNKLLVPADGKGVFPYLSDNSFVIRITEDKNGNGVWDTGSLDQRIQPERVRFYTLSNGVDIIEIKNKLDLEQIIDIEELFDHDAAPIIPTKPKR